MEEQAPYTTTRPNQHDKHCHLIRNAMLAIESQRRTIFLANCEIAVVIKGLERDLKAMHEEIGTEVAG